MRIRPFFRWYDLWIGAYVWWPARTVFICPIPMFGLRIEFVQETDYNALISLVDDKSRLEKLTNQQLVQECLQTTGTDFAVVDEMMTRLDPKWSNEEAA